MNTPSKQYEDALNTDLDYVCANTFQIIRLVGSLQRTVRILNWELEQRRRQNLNLEKRKFALEERQPRKKRSNYD